MTERSIATVIAAHEAPVGTFSVLRALPVHERKSVGPWVFLDHFGPFRIGAGNSGVPPHPHAGIETVTYLLAGNNRHRDSAGHEGIVSAGGAQWMTAGRGIVHAEQQIARPGEETVHGLQLWTSLPRALKTMAPRYQRIAAEDIPEVAVPGGSVRVIAGALGAVPGPADVLMPTLLWHVRLAAGARFAADLPAGHEVAAYVIDGVAQFADGDRAARRGQLVVFAETSGGMAVQAGEAPLDLLILGGAPAEGPLVFHGPFVMNTVEQVRTAERDYHAGRMGSLVA